MLFEDMGIRSKPKHVREVVGQARITAVTLETGEISHGQMWLFFRGDNYRGTVEVVIVNLAYMCE